MNEPQLIKKEVKSISGLAQSIKYVLRGIFFVLYFPFYFVFQVFVSYGYISSLSPSYG